MGGMLYKDFTAVKGKRILIILSVSTLVFLILRFAFPGSDLSETAKGTASFEFSGDFFLWALPLLEATVFFGLPSVLIKGLIAQDFPYLDIAKDYEITSVRKKQLYRLQICLFGCYGLCGAVCFDNLV